MQLQRREQEASDRSFLLSSRTIKIARKKEKTQKGDCVGSTEHPGLLTPEGVMLESVKPHLYNEIKVDHDCGGGVE